VETRVLFFFFISSPGTLALFVQHGEGWTPAVGKIVQPPTCLRGKNADRCCVPVPPPPPPGLSAVVL